MPARVGRQLKVGAGLGVAMLHANCCACNAIGAAAPLCAAGNSAGDQPPVACLPVPQTPLQGAGSGATHHRPPEEPTPITLAAR